MKRIILACILALGLTGCRDMSKEASVYDVESINCIAPDRIAVTYRNGTTYEFVPATEPRQNCRKYLFIKTEFDKNFKLYELAP